MKGIILAGGAGSRLYPITLGVSKALLPIYDTPMIYYPLNVLIKAGIRDIMIISTPYDMPYVHHLLGDGEQLGISLTYQIQNKNNGIAEAFILAEDFIKNEPCVLILGDNVFIGQEVSNLLKDSLNNIEEATIFGYAVSDPERFGVIEIKDNKIISIEEKPKNPKSNYCVTGLYIYPDDVSSKAKTLKPSQRNELEITDINNLYLAENRLNVRLLSNSNVWIDTGTNDSLLKASNIVKDIEDKKFIVACLEESAYRNNWISIDDLKLAAHKFKNNNYGKYINKIIEEEEER